ncbi:hypothetical protein FGO68_gene856 [Halteria grandinella]|uniref:Lipase n=1 Tax=Halteria grandinella TaxID=5974 RepID=A0A8J8NRF7_HALGN|nr:hypothetical protein FGO68_gene856 [Halteria grandinella]
MLKSVFILSALISTQALASSPLFLQAHAHEEVHNITGEKLIPNPEPSFHDNDGLKSLAQICKENGFAFEEHKVTTEDGYILTIHRIPGLLHELNETKTTFGPKPVVFLMHGMTGDASMFLLNAPFKTIGFLAVKAGFDVWLGNNRGCKYSLEHTHLKHNDKTPAYWDFDFEDMGTKDLPAMINYTLNATGAEKLSLIGYSMGATQTFAGMSMIPHYFEKTVNLFVGLGPATRLINCRAEALKGAVADMEVIKFVFVDILKEYDFFAPTWLSSLINGEKMAIFPKSFEKFMSSFDMDPYVEERGRIKSISGHLPSGAGYRNFIHYGQLINSDTFKRYDYGASDNLHHYGQLTPPDYPLHASSKLPIALFGGYDDEMADPRDVQWLAEQLGTHRVIGQYMYEKKGHLTFAFGKNMSYFEEDVIPLLHKYETEPRVTVV